MSHQQPPAVCYTCGADVPETPRFGNEATCDACARSGRDPREKGDDDGVEYADPRDARDERL